MDHRAVAAWTFGEAFLDHAIGPTGLAADSVHEIKPGRLPLTASAGDGTEPMGDAAPLPDWSGAWGAARLLALTLAIRRLALLRDQNPDAPQTTLWCQPAHASRDLGAFYAPGLAQIGLPPENLIIVETRRPDETLWTLEEALRAGSLALVIGQLDAVDLTPARRLALAAQQHGTPCLLLTHPDSPSAAATASRWRARPSAGGAHPLQTIAGDVVHRLPGPPRLRLSPERLRGRALFSSASGYEVEWCDETFCFRVATPFRDRADGARRTRRHSA
ncbi:MAG: hypothetical protein KDJ36_11975 [Hyphomicrobiaceae bacterium]|nr:hypothetical protein [Hyphomicrobiaceae bacterium]